MAYVPPLNGGRINATISGNTAGAGSLVSTGTLTLAGGNNITLSQAGNAITLSAPTISSVSATGAVSISTNGNTVSIGAPVQSNQTMGFYATGNTTQSSSTTLDARSLTFNGLGGVSVGYSNGSVQISGATGGGGGGIALANSQTTFTSGTANLIEGGGAITIASTTGQSFKVSVPVVSSLSVTGALSLSTNGNTISVGAPYFNGLVSTGGNTSGNTGTIASQTQLVLAGGNNVTLSQATAAGGATVSINGITNALTSQSNQTLSLLADTNGNTVGQSSASTFNATSLPFKGLGGVSVGFSGSSVVLSAPTSYLTTARASNDAIGLNTAQTNVTWTVNSSGISLNGAGYAGTGFSGTNASATLNSNGLQLSVGAGGGGGGSNTFGVSNLAGSSGTSGVVSGTGLQYLFAGSNLTLNQSLNGASGTVTLSAPAVSQLTYTGALSMSSNGSTISIGAPATSSLIGTNGISVSTTSNSIYVDGSGAGGGGVTASRYIYPNEYMPLNTIGAANNSVSFNYVSMSQNASASQFRALFSVSASTHTSASTNTYALTAEVGVYTLNASTISKMSSGSQTWSGTYSTNNTASVQGIRELTIPMNVSLTPGEYWFGFRISSASTNASVGYSQYVVSNQQTGHLTPGRFGAATNTSQLLYPFHGLYTTSTSALPASVTLNNVNGTGTRASAANFWFDLRNYTLL